MSENTIPAAAPVVVVQRTENLPLTPMQSGALTTGANLQIGSPRDVATIASVDLRVRLDKAIRQAAAAVKKLQTDLYAAQREYEAEVKKIGVPSNLEADVDQLVVALRRFHPQAAKAVVPVPDAHGNETGSTKPKSRVEVDAANKTYEVTLYVRLGSRHDEMQLDRTFALPGSVVAALDKIAGIRTSIGVAESRALELRTERGRIPEYTEQFVADLMRQQLSSLPEGGTCVATLDQTRQGILKNLGLSLDDDKA